MNRIVWLVTLAALVTLGTSATSDAASHAKKHAPWARPDSHASVRRGRSSRSLPRRPAPSGQEGRCNSDCQPGRRRE